jgi:hypothetical protein
MFVTLLCLISRVIFFELDVGVDIRVANQKRKSSLKIVKDSTEIPNIAEQFSCLFDRDLYVFKDNTYSTPLESLDFEPIHFLLTTAWLLSGGIIQSVVLMKNIRNQSYIPFIWKAAIIMSRRVPRSGRPC